MGDSAAQNVQFRNLKLPFQFDRDRLRADLDRIAPDDWVPHFNKACYEGGWSGVSLRSVGGVTGHIYPDPTAGDRYADTPILARCDYLPEVLAAFQCPLLSVRLLKLDAGSVIRTHRDYNLSYADGEIRLHVPIVTNPDVEFIVDGERVVMREGECWFHDFGLPHSIANRGATDRIHLVLDCAVNDWMRAFFAA